VSFDRRERQSIARGGSPDPDGEPDRQVSGWHLRSRPVRTSDRRASSEGRRPPVNGVKSSKRLTHRLPDLTLRQEAREMGIILICETVHCSLGITGTWETLPSPSLIAGRSPEQPGRSLHSSTSTLVVQTWPFATSDRGLHCLPPHHSITRDDIHDSTFRELSIDTPATVMILVNGRRGL
jgi:hypothetical protein